MFEAGVPLNTDPQLREASEQSFAVLRRRRKAGRADAGQRPSAGADGGIAYLVADPRIASLFARGDAARRALPMPPEELLEAAVLIYFRGLGLMPRVRSHLPVGEGNPSNRLCVSYVKVLTLDRRAPNNVNVIYIHERSTMQIPAMTPSPKSSMRSAARLDRLTVLGFMAVADWPWLLAFTIGSGRMGCGYQAVAARIQPLAAQDGTHAA